MLKKKEERHPSKGGIGYTGGSDYELLPHREIMELREELLKLKHKPSEKTLQIAMVELSAKLDKLMDIFEEAREEIRIEEGGLTFQERMKPLMGRMEKILEQNSQIAEGIVAVADLIGEMKEGGVRKEAPVSSFHEAPALGGGIPPAPLGMPEMPPAGGMSEMPPPPGEVPEMPPPPGGMPPPPPMPKKKKLGLF